MGDRLQRIADDLLDRAEAAVAEQDWAAVRTHAEDALALVPGAADAKALRDLAMRHLDEPTVDSGRRQVTMLFADLVGSTAMSARLDPEVYARLIRRYQRTCRSAVEAFGGRVHEEQGDGFVAVFGYPSARGDDAQRALAAALKITDDVQLASTAAAEYDESLNARIGVHTGLAVVAGDGLYGETSNVAARVQAKAEPGTVLTTGATAALAGDLFDLAPLGSAVLRGIDEPVDLFKVTSTSNRVRLLEESRIGPMVGRAVELATIKEAWAGITADQPGSMVIIEAGPGMGKSRLVEELRRQVEADGQQILVMPASSIDTAVALHPVVRGLAAQLDLHRVTQPTEALDRLRNLLEGFDLADDENLALLAALFGLGELVDAPKLDPSQLRERRLNLLYGLLQGAGRDGSMLLILEDLHWADATTLDLLGRFEALGLPPNVLLVATTRPDSRLDLLGSPRITLQALSREASGFIAQHLGTELSDHDLDEVVTRSDGVPLYLEQLVLSMADDTNVPATLTELFQGRLDAAGPAKSLAQFGAAFGRSFPLALAESAVQRLGGLDPRDPMTVHRGSLDALADDLARSGLVEFEADGTVRFCHALVRDAAYDSQLMTERPARHQSIAEALESSPELVSPSLVAFHYEQAGLPHEAVPRWMLGADHQAALGESTLAIQQLHEAEKLLADLDPAYAKPYELGICMKIATLTAGQAGYAAPTVDELYQRSLGLCDELEGVTDMSFNLVATLLGLWTYHCMAGRLDEASAVSDRLESLIEKTDFPGGLGSVRANRGVEAFIRGDLGTARRLLLASVDAYEDGVDLTTWPLPNDGLCGTLAVLALVEELRGEPAQAQELRDRATQRADALPYPLGPFSLTFASAYEAWGGYLAGDYERCVTAATDTVTIGERHGFAEWQLMGAIHLTGGQLLAGDFETVVDEMTPLVQLVDGLGAHAPLASFWATIAEANAKLERWDDAEAAVASGMRFVQSVGHELAVPPLQGVNARIAAARGDGDAARAALVTGLLSATSNENRAAERRLHTVADELGIAIEKPEGQQVSA